MSDTLLVWDDAVRLLVHDVDRQGASRVYKNRSLAYMRYGRYEDALRDTTTAVEIAPYDFTAHCFRGLTLFLMRRLDESKQHYERAIVLNPKYADGYMGRARANAGLGNHEAALADYRQACKLGIAWACKVVKRREVSPAEAPLPPG